MRYNLLLCFLFSVFFTQAQNISETEVRVTDLISGSLLKPEKQTDTLVIIIAGSGPTDRNGNQQMMNNNSLKKLAQQLTKNGFASYRYDKRLFALMRQNALIEEQLRFDDFVNDAVAVTKHFKDQGYDHIILLGHSQGALIAKLAALQTSVDKVISLAGAGQSIDNLIIDQLKAQAPGLVENARQAFTDLREKGKAESYSPGLSSLFRPSVQPFMKSWVKYNPAETIASLELPILLVSGSKDLQIPSEETEYLKKAQPNAQLVMIENMNHVLTIIEGDDIENGKSYNESARAISSELIEVITSFIRTN